MFAEVLLLMAALMLATVGQWIALDQRVPFFQSFDPHTKHEWVGRINGSIVQILVIGYALIQGRTSHWGACLLLAYLLHDTCHMLVYERDITSYLHHVVSTTVFGLTKLVMTPDQADSTTIAMAILESTSPVLSATWLLKQAGYSDQPFFKYVAGFAAIFFGVMRCGVFPWIMTKMDKSSKLIFAPLLALNIYWFWKIIKMMLKVLAKKEETASSSEQSHEV
jgi:hypothetical protein